MGKLTARKVETAKAGKYGDGGGLQMAVAPGGARKWVLRFLWQGRPREMGLGSYPEVGLADAREKALAGRRLARSGIDPIAARKKSEGVPTFGEIADEIAGQLAEGFRNEKHKAQWRMTLTVYAEPFAPSPSIRSRRLTSSQFCNRSGRRSPRRLPAFAGASNAFSTRPSPRAAERARTRPRGAGTWKTCCPSRLSLSRGHHAAMRYQDVPAFVARLREREAVAALALEFAILTATRSGEVLGARWLEIDLDAKVWTIPPERMKAAREHRVPLSERTIAILEQWRPRGRESSCSPVSAPTNRFQSWRWRWFCAAWGLRTPRCMASGALSAIGPATKRISRASLPNTPLRTSSATRPNKRTVDPMHWRGDASLWTHGQNIAKARPARTSWRSNGRHDGSVAASLPTSYPAGS